MPHIQNKSPVEKSLHSKTLAVKENQENRNSSQSELKSINLHIKTIGWGHKIVLRLSHYDSQGLRVKAIFRQKGKQRFAVGDQIIYLDGKFIDNLATLRSQLGRAPTRKNLKYKHKGKIETKKFIFELSDFE